MIQATGGPRLDESLASLVPFNRWYLEQARAAMDDPGPGLPEWVQPLDPRIRAGTRK